MPGLSTGATNTLLRALEGQTRAKAAGAGALSGLIPGIQQAGSAIAGGITRREDILRAAEEAENERQHEQDMLNTREQGAWDRFDLTQEGTQIRHNDRLQQTADLAAQRIQGQFDLQAGRFENEEMRRAAEAAEKEKEAADKLALEKQQRQQLDNLFRPVVYETEVGPQYPGMVGPITRVEQRFPTFEEVMQRAKMTEAPRDLVMDYVKQVFSTKKAAMAPTDPLELMRAKMEMEQEFAGPQVEPNVEGYAKDRGVTFREGMTMADVRATEKMDAPPLEAEWDGRHTAYAAMLRNKAGDLRNIAANSVGSAVNNIPTLLAEADAADRKLIAMTGFEGNERATAKIMKALAALPDDAALEMIQKLQAGTYEWDEETGNFHEVP